MRLWTWREGQKTFSGLPVKTNCYFCRSRTRELPGNYPFSVKERLILESVKQWSDLSHECFTEVKDIVVKHIIRVVEDHFKGYNNGGLKEAVRLGQAPISRLLLLTLFETCQAKSRRSRL